MLKAYAQMLPRLQAEEALRQITLNSVASGNVKQGKVKSLTRELRKQASAGRKSKPADPKVLQQIGIKVKHVSKP